MLNLFEGDHPVFLKIISRLENRFKNILIYFNLQFLNAESIKPQSLLKYNNIDNYIRVFFSSEDYLIWNKLFPFNDELVCKMLEGSITQKIRNGGLNEAMKLKFIKLIIEDADSFALNIGRVFFSLSERFYNSGEILKFFNFF